MKAIYIWCTEMRLAFGMKKNEIIAVTSTDNNRDNRSHIEFGRCISCAYSGRAGIRYRRYHHHHHHHHHHGHYHEPTIITVARLTVINHATGMIRLNCCSHVSALDACRAWVVAWSEKRCRPGVAGGMRRG